MKKVTCIIAAVVSLIMFSSMAICVFAEDINIDATADLIINFKPDDKPTEGAKFRLYRIADISRTGKVTLTSPFSDFPVIFEQHDANSLKNLALTLRGYVYLNGIKPDYKGETKENGKVSFLEIPLGMYLVVGESVDIDSRTFVPESFIITLPAEAENGVWEYEAEVITKSFSGGLDDKVKVTVQKIWDDKGNEKDRPSEVEVHLFKGSVLFSVAILTKENGWKYQWDNLDKLTGYDWTVVETFGSEGYRVSIERTTEGTNNYFFITNTYDEENPPSPETTVGDTKPGGTGGTEPDTTTGRNPLASTTKKGDAEESKPTLPQTGMLWWPVPICAFIGVVFVMIGWKISRRDDNEI